MAPLPAKRTTRYRPTRVPGASVPPSSRSTFKPENGPLRPRTTPARKDSSPASASSVRRSFMEDSESTRSAGALPLGRKLPQLLLQALEAVAEDDLRHRTIGLGHHRGDLGPRQLGVDAEEEEGLVVSVELLAQAGEPLPGRGQEG